MFAVSADHEEIGRIQGRQFAALLPRGGSVLYIKGPSRSSSARKRTAGMIETKPSNIQAAMLRANAAPKKSPAASRIRVAQGKVPSFPDRFHVQFSDLLQI